MPKRLDRFDPTIPIERAPTPPSTWYTDPGFHEFERRTVLRRSWQAVGRLDQLDVPGRYVSGEFAGEPWVVVRAEDGELRAFYNVCRHHAACVAQGEGSTRRFVCPYHGWTYDLDGRLRTAPRMAGIEAFDRDRYGLVPMGVGTWGPFVFIRLEPAEDGQGALDELLRPLEGRIDTRGLRFVRQVRYELECNWKVYVDNYLDGGYHVAHLHRGLASQLDLATYTTEIEGAVSVQSCRTPQDAPGTDGEDFAERLGRGAAYAFVYPNFMINRYGPIMDTNWVVPLGHERTLTVFDYYFEPGCTAEYVERSLAASERVQQEDIDVCEAVQRGLRSSAFDRGVYAPQVEQGAHHFHCLLAREEVG